MNDPIFDSMVQECWDDGRDPVDDARVQQHLSAHPELLEAFAHWRAAVHALPVARGRRRAPWAWVAAAAAGLALVAWWQSGGDTSSAPDLGGAGTVLSSTFETADTGPRVTVSWRERRVLVATPETHFAITEHRSAPR